jgi:hypothetical protein
MHAAAKSLMTSIDVEMLHVGYRVDSGKRRSLASCSRLRRNSSPPFYVAFPWRFRFKDYLVDGRHCQRRTGAKSRIIAWRHQSGFDEALELIVNDTGKFVDDGRGDATFVAPGTCWVTAVRTVDVDGNPIADCRSRFASRPNLRFVMVAELDDLSELTEAGGLGQRNDMVCRERVDTRRGRATGGLW